MKKIKRLRLSVFRSNKHIYSQIIDDEAKKTLAAASDKDIKTKQLKKDKMKIAFQVGEILAQKAKKQKINKVYFDRNKYKYHGRVKQLAEGARKGGLDF